jgi:sigma-E factor negative regulatory protein RseC
MQTAVAIVRQIEGSRVEVEVLSEGCGRCHEAGGCGGHNLARSLCNGKRFWIATDSPVGIGRRVTVGVDAGSVRAAASKAYVVPLLAILGGAFIGARLGSLESILGAALGLAIAWFGLAKWRRPFAAPIILGPAPDGG